MNICSYTDTGKWFWIFFSSHQITIIYGSNHSHDKVWLICFFFFILENIHRRNKEPKVACLRLISHMESRYTTVFYLATTLTQPFSVFVTTRGWTKFWQEEKCQHSKKKEKSSVSHLGSWITNLLKKKKTLLFPFIDSWSIFHDIQFTLSTSQPQLESLIYHDNESSSYKTHFKVV